MIVPTVNGVAPDGLPFEAGIALDSRYTTSFASWVKELVESGGAENTDPPVQPVAPPARRRARAVEATATLTRDQEVQS